VLFYVVKILIGEQEGTFLLQSPSVKLDNNAREDDLLAFASVELS